MRSVTAIEAGVGIAVIGSLLAVAVPAFVKNLSSSRLVEATSGVTRIGAHAIEHASGKSCADAFPARAALTPDHVPRGKAAVDGDPDPWQNPTWKALDFRPSPPGVAHSFSFAFDPEVSATHTTSSFVASAHGDLDGDGTTSTFEVRGKCDATTGSVLTPGMYVDAELE